MKNNKFSTFLKLAILFTGSCRNYFCIDSWCYIFSTRQGFCRPAKSVSFLFSAMNAFDFHVMSFFRHLSLEKKKKTRF